MHRHLTHLQNPNHIFGCHPHDFHGYFDFKSAFDGSGKPLKSQFDQSVIINSHQHYRRKALDRILNRASVKDLPGFEHFVMHLQEKYRRNCRPNTLRATGQALMQFLSFCHDLGKERIELIGRHEIEAFIEYEQDRGLKPASVRTTLSMVYAFLRFLIKKNVLGNELLERRIKLRLPDYLPRAIESEHVRQLLSVVDHTRDRAMILLLLRTGMRIGELLNTTVDDIDLSNQKILIYQAEKTWVGRVVYFSEDAREALYDWLRERNAQIRRLFYGKGRKSMSYESARSFFKKYVNKAGLQYHGYTLHCLRHTFATDLLNARMPLECLRVLLGHTNLEMTRRYAKLTDKTREEEYFNAINKVIKNDFDEYDGCVD
jgi:integrase/recombinase XerD